MIKLVEGAVAVGFGAASALVTAKSPGDGPGGISWPVYLEAGGVVVGLFGDRVGLPTEIRDPMLFAAITLAGARLAKAASAGTLLQGPKAWGGLGGFSAGDRYRSNPDPAALSDAAAASIRLLPGRSATQSSFGMSPALFETAGVTG